MSACVARLTIDSSTPRKSSPRKALHYKTFRLSGNFNPATGGMDCRMLSGEHGDAGLQWLARDANWTAHNRVHLCRVSAIDVVSFCRSAGCGQPAETDKCRQNNSQQSLSADRRISVCPASISRRYPGLYQKLVHRLSRNGYSFNQDCEPAYGHSPWSVPCH